MTIEEVLTLGDRNSELLPKKVLSGKHVTNLPCIVSEIVMQ